MKLHWIWMCSLISVVFAAQEESVMIKTTYCACRCCEENQDVCFRHDSIPATYKCSESMCSESFCKGWEKAKCKKDCFCEVCKDKIEKDDLRCLTKKKLPENCECDPKMPCEYRQKPPNEIIKESGSKSQIHCMVPCLCKKCRNALPPSIYSDCMMDPQLPEECECTDVKCPSKAVLDGLKKVEEMREKKKGKDASQYSFSQEIDEMMEPEKARDVKCRMQCFCDKCSVGNDKISTNCEKMLPKPRVKDCVCGDDITCPSDDVDQHCKLYCFCNGCSSSPKMPKSMKQACEAMTKKEQACMCADEENCDVLDKLPEMEKAAKMADKMKDEQAKKKKSKKGKLKPKKQDKDEL